MLHGLVQHRIMALIELASMIKLLSENKMADTFTAYSTIDLPIIKKYIYIYFFS